VPADEPTIQGAIDVAAPGDLVLVRPGTYEETINFGGKPVTVASTRGPTRTFIDGAGAGSVVTFESGERRSSQLRGFTITGGDAGAGGGHSGGGVLIVDSSPRVVGNRITGNIACNAGGGIHVDDSSPLLKENLVTHNHQEECIGGVGGGGIAVVGEGSARLVGNVIANNSWGSSGGGVTLFAAGTPVIRDNVVRDNVAGNNGGGFYIVNHSDARIVNNVVTRNAATEGGGFYVGVGQGDRGAALLNNTVVGNRSATGGALYVGGFPHRMKVVNNIFMTRRGEAVACEDLRSTEPPQLRYNDIKSHLGPETSGSCSAAVGVDGNISRLPGFVDVVGRDLRLGPGSPLVDAGTTTGVTLPPLDRFGLERVADGDGDGAIVVDMGAHERPSQPAR